MSGSRPKPEGHLAEQHLGDRLSALVDGELGHDARERVLAHVATCPKCKAEVDAQRRLKNVFAEAAQPTPSESFLARLQGLPGGGDADGRCSPPRGGDFSSGMPGMPGKFEFGYVPARPHSSLLPSSSAGRGFRIHDVSRHESERSASRGMRFAFVAAGAVSLAAIALGGVTLGTPDMTTEARGSGTGSNVTPLGTPSAGAGKSPESQRRRSVGPLLGQAQGRQALGESPVVPTEASAPLVPGPSALTAGDPRQRAVRALTTPVTAVAVSVPPLIRPLDAVPPLALSAWPSPPVIERPGLFAAPVPDPLSSPGAPPSPAVSHRPAP